MLLNSRWHLYEVPSTCDLIDQDAIYNIVPTGSTGLQEVHSVPFKYIAFTWHTLHARQFQIADI